MFPLALLALLHSPPDVTAADLARFPSPEQAVAARQLARDHLDYLALYRQTHGDGWGLREWADEARELERCWDDLVLAHYGRSEWERGINDDMDALRDLRRRVGPAAYGAGVMPCPVPARRFEWRD
jgi:hypothetical protein